MQDMSVTVLTPSAGAASADESSTSALSWASIIGGALATVAVSLILVTLAGALGIAPNSPPDSDRMTWVVSSIAAIWLILTQWIASAIGGYLTGRLRTKWVAVHTHEVFFRDTAHGFLAWSVAMIFSLIVLSSTAASALGHGIPGWRGRNAQGGTTDPLAYYIDSLYRPDASITAAPAKTADMAAGTEGAANMAPPALSAPHVTPELRAESTHILARGMGKDGMADDDKTYLSQLVATNTGLSATDATKRVNDTLAKARDDAGKAKKAIGYVALFTGLSMLVGAFIASVAAAIGGSQRDEWETAVRNGTYGVKEKD